ncbi:uncharacterized protein LOC114570244 [Perca flavescens]|uniref:uncharacterized protein LOC114570244 n=1 Tax=Perca flavescens TaxID=8167 RepID=UPI00106E845D|nr:uncharacterized protein LOC114570244 [Perca flavescens]
MTSCVLSLFFLLFLCSSITADGPTGLKVRITNKATEFLKDFGLKFLKILVKKPFEDFQLLTCHIKSLTLTHLDVDQDNVVVRFQPGSGLQFEFRDLNITAEIERGTNRSFFNIFQGTAVVTGQNVGVTIGVRLIQTGGRLSLEIPSGDDYCKTRADRIRVDNLGFVVNTALTAALRFAFTSQFCPAIRNLVPNVNTMLAGVAMTRTLSEDHKINLDYSLSGNVTVTSNSLDVPFTNLVLTIGPPCCPAHTLSVPSCFRSSDRWEGIQRLSTQQAHKGFVVCLQLKWRLMMKSLNLSHAQDCVVLCLCGTPNKGVVDVADDSF